MIDPFIPGVGRIMSADIAVPQHERMVQFYTDVLSTGERPLWREDLMNNLGMPVIGLGARTAEYADIPLQWMPHFQVADVARSAECALGLGGSEVLHGRGEDGNSQWAVLLDPNGAAFGIIPVPSADELPPREEDASRDGAASAGCISWVDLTVSNASVTRDFYHAVIGWSVQDIEVQDTSERYADYKMLGDDGNPAAAVRHARGANLGLSPVWMLHLPVGDLAESLRLVREGGGKLIKETTGADGGCVSAVIQDPVGVCLALVPG